MLSLCQKAVTHVIVERTAAVVLLLASAAGDASAHRLVAQLHDFRLYALCFQCLCGHAQRMEGVALFMRAAIDQ